MVRMALSNASKFNQNGVATLYIADKDVSINPSIDIPTFKRRI
jgi:hypothetical protein